MEFEPLKNLDQSTDLREVIEKYLNHYKWFILSILIVSIGTFFKLRYEPPQYNISASILIKKQEGNSSFSELSSYEDIGLAGLAGGNLENEMQVLQSTRLMINVVKDLKLNYSYFSLDQPFESQLYPNYPFIVTVKSDSLLDLDVSTYFKIKMISMTEFRLEDFDGKLMENLKFGEVIKVDLGNKNESNLQEIVVQITDDNSNKWIGESILVKIVSLESSARLILSKLVVEPINERYSDVISFSINDMNVNKGISIINNLIEQYNADGKNEKVEQTQSTIDFLDLRIGLLSAELNVIENSAEQFKTKKGLVNVDSGGDLFLASSTSNEREIIKVNTERQLVGYLMDELDRVADGKLLPSNIGLSDQRINSSISEYNELILKRNRILNSSSTLNPIIVNIDSELNSLKTSLVESLKSINSSLEIRIQGLNLERGQISSRIASVPKNEKTYKDIVREQETKNELYLFLLQKREEAIVSGAANVTKAKVINEANSSGEKVSPNKLLSYLAGIFLGLLIPFLIIFTMDLLDTKVHDQSDLNKLNIPYLGDFPKSVEKNKYLITEGDTSSTAEAFRFIRTNINFLLDKTEKSRIIFVTSTKANEGKTFTSLKLASSLALSGKKTLLVTMDLRKPKIFKYLGLKDKHGITNFLANHNLSVDNIIVNCGPIPNLDICGSGDIPPNPVELLMNDRVEELFEYTKENYDYVIVDTAPVGMVTDTLQISKYADLTIYVVKSNYLDKRMLHIPKKMHEENKLRNMAFLINGVSQTKNNYGYGYGYGDSENKAWFGNITKYFKS